MNSRKKVAVVGGGLAGLAAALELVDSGHDVVLHEARPTLGGAVQTLPERDGDPPPPPDNGQHIALGCFTEYRRFVERIGKAGALRREKLRLPVFDEQGRVATIGPGLRLLGYSHLPLKGRIRVARRAFSMRKRIRPTTPTRRLQA
jgi:protoporphyrinogen oxidase